MVLKSGSLNLLQPSGSVQACIGIALLYTSTISKSVFMQADADIRGTHVGLRNRLYTRKAEYPVNVFLVRDCVPSLYEMTTFSFLLQLKEFPQQLLLLHRKLQSTACDSFLLTRLHFAPFGKTLKVSGKVRHVEF
jgi:hypothetical protein